jgi:hypothetical protein
VVLTTHSLLAPRSRKSRAIPLLHLWAFVVCYRVTFTFTFINFLPGGCIYNSVVWNVFEKGTLKKVKVKFRIGALQHCSPRLIVL